MIKHVVVKPIIFKPRGTRSMVQLRCKFITRNGLNSSISRFFKRHEASHASRARVKKYAQYVRSYNV